jgi:hypothetical protein
MALLSIFVRIKDALSVRSSPLRDKPLRLPGQSVDDQIENQRMDIVTYILFPTTIIALIAAQWVDSITPKSSNSITVPSFISWLILPGFLTYCAYRVYKALKTIERLKMARDGERIVAEELQTLVRSGATVINDVIADNFNIDHVVVSKHGIYLIETKTLSKPVKKDAKITFDAENIYVDGKTIERNPINQVKALSDWLQNLLKESTGIKFKIHPVVLFPGWFTEKMKGGEDIWVLNPKALPTFISNEPVSLKDTDVHLAAFHLSRYVRTFTPKEGK